MRHMTLTFWPAVQHIVPITVMATDMAIEYIEDNETGRSSFWSLTS